MPSMRNVWKITARHVMSEFFSYSPHNGMRYDSEEEDTEITIHSSQDVQSILDKMSAKRSMPESERKKHVLRHYCSIPTEVEIELRAKGIDIWNKHQTKELIREIEQNYPKLKATRMHHEI